MYNKPEADRYFTKTLTYYTFILVLFSFLISAFSREIITTIARNSEFHVAYKVVPLLCFPFILKGIQYVFALGLHFVKKTKYNAIIVSTISLLNIGLNLLFIPILGIYGAAISTIICWIIITIVYFKISQRFYPVSYEIRKIVLLLLVFIIFTVLVFFLDDLLILPRLGIKTLLFLLIPIVLIPFKFYESIEVERIKGAWHKWKRIYKWPEYITKIKL
jgi:O-antigen/teichoic acid export membrane protein